ncbi:SDR family oxidoreductase [Seongchinamella unica]|uniref:SDR family oxidoreductase n=1 Tax=Seongchinamella unica TaxID=2547392 RepID=A0A4R5LRG1_9GAMM|nr:SDR family oxidoreductase [Seongchinamella unica]TDG13441.1 SDR family oxidoreductase [Seongchinamella unica]
MNTKNILVTGGTRGIGRAMAIALAGLGNRVAVTGRNEQKLREVARELPGGIAILADVTDAAHSQSVIDEVTTDIGPIEVLINNAGIGGGTDGPQLLIDMDADDWWRVQETNVRGPMLYTKAVLPGMIERGEGIIINVGSYLSIRPSPMATAYGTSKAALARFTDCLAVEVADQGVQVFCISPGLVLTDMTRDLPFINDIPEDDFQRPEDVAGLACELVTGKYGKLSGHFIHVKDELATLLANAERLKKERLYQLSLHGLEGLID